MNSTILLAAFALAGAATTATAATSVLNFDSFADASYLTTQYTGVSFSGAQVLSEGLSLSPFFPPFSPLNVVTNYQNAGVTLTFTGQVNSVGAYVTGNETIIEYAFDSHGMAFASAVTSGANDLLTGLPPNEYISVSGGGTNIAGVIFEDVTDSKTYAFTLDNLTVDGDPIGLAGGVPEPASWALMLVGFGGLGVAMRRSRRLVAVRAG